MQLNPVKLKVGPQLNHVVQFVCIFQTCYKHQQSCDSLGMKPVWLWRPVARTTHTEHQVPKDFLGENPEGKMKWREARLAAAVEKNVHRLLTDQSAFYQNGDASLQINRP